MSRVPGFLAVPTLRNASAPSRDDADDVGQRLDVVDDGRPLVQAAHGQARRPVARIAALALDRGDQRRRPRRRRTSRRRDRHEVAREVGAEDALAEVAGRVRLLERAGETAVGQVELAADVDERVAHLQRVRRDQHRLEQQVRRVLENPAVLEGARLALVGVRAQVVRLAVVEIHDAPLAARGKGGAAAALDAGRRDLRASPPRGVISRSAFSSVA